MNSEGNEDDSTYLMPQEPTPPSRSHLFPPGSIIASRFKIVRFISRGGMGEVYEAHDQVLGDRVALKTILPKLVDLRMIRRFKEEIRSAKRVTHENVCRIHDIFTHTDSSGDTPFLSMELLEGKTLRQHLATGPISETDAFPLIEQIAEGLSAIHRAGIVHRDLKPGNVMLVKNSHGVRAVIMDLGLAREQAVESGSSSRAIEGTWEYMAPEQLTGSQATKAADIYAFGLVAYEMVTGRLPFEAPSRREVGFLRLLQQPKSPREFRPALESQWERAILNCLQREPSERFASAVEFVAALKKPTAVPWLSPKRLAIGVLALVVASLLFWTWYTAPFSPPAEAMKWFQTGSRALDDGTYFSAVRALERAVKISPAFGQAHLRMAEAWIALDAPDRAREALIRADTDAGRGLTAREKRRLQAVRDTLTFDFKSAAAGYKHLSQNAASEDQAAALVEFGLAAERNGELKASLSAYSKASTVSPQYAGAHLRLGVLYARQQDPAKAAAELKEAETLYQSASNQEGVTEVLYQRGALANTRGLTQEAVPVLQQVIEMATTLDNPHQRIRAMLQMSNAEFRTGDTDRAQQFASEALSLARGTGLEQLATRGLIDLGNTVFVRGDRQRAVEYFTEALGFAERFHNTRHEAAALFMLGNIDSLSSRPEAAVEKLGKARLFYEKNGFLREESQTLMLLARVQNTRGEYARARESYSKQLELAKGLKDRQQEASAIEGLGRVAERREDYVEALARYEQAYDIGVELKRQSRIAFGAFQMADILWRLGRTADARRRLAEAEEIAKKATYSSLSQSIHRVRAEIALSELDLASAIRWSEKAAVGEQDPEFAIENERARALSMVRLGRIKEGFAILKRLSESSVKEVPANTAELVLAFSEAALLSRDPRLAVETASTEAKVLEPYGKLESRWRLLAIAALGEKQVGEEPKGKNFAEAAAIAYRSFSASIGPENARTYLARAEIRSLAVRLKGFGVELPKID